MLEAQHDGGHAFFCLHYGSYEPHGIVLAGNEPGFLFVTSEIRAACRGKLGSGMSVFVGVYRQRERSG